MSRVVKRNINLLRALALMKPKQSKEVLKTADKGLIQSVCECALNLLKGNVRVNPSKRKQLAKFKLTLRRLVKKGESFKKKRKYLVQKGGGILVPILLSAVLQSLIN